MTPKVVFFVLMLVPLTGLEPVRCCHRGILSPLRLPIPPSRLMALTIYIYNACNEWAVVYVFRNYL